MSHKGSKRSLDLKSLYKCDSGKWRTQRKTFPKWEIIDTEDEFASGPMPSQRPTNFSLRSDEKYFIRRKFYSIYNTRKRTSLYEHSQLLIFIHNHIKLILIVNIAEPYLKFQLWLTKVEDNLHIRIRISSSGCLNSFQELSKRTLWLKFNSGRRSEALKGMNNVLNI